MKDRYKLSFPLPPRGFAARSRVLARLASLAEIGELARRLSETEKDRNRPLKRSNFGLCASAKKNVYSNFSV